MIPKDKSVIPADKSFALPENLAVITAGRYREDMDEHQDRPSSGGQSGGAMSASTWREAGRFLTPTELSGMTVDEQADYQIRSAPRTLDEIDAMPEPQRSVFLRLEARAAARQQRRAS